MASYNELLNYWLTNINPDVPFIQSKEGQDLFNSWIGGIAADLGVATGDDVPLAELDNYEYTGPVSNPVQPAEQVIGNAILPGVIKQVEGDAARQAEAEKLTEQTGQDFAGLRNTLDLANVAVDPATGQLTSPLLTSQRANVDAATATEKAAASAAATAQLDALAQSIAQMQGNYTAAGAARANALQTQIASLKTNLEGMTTAQKAALEQQIAELNAAQTPMNEARLQAAEGLVTAVNVGLEGVRDQLTADAAREGFVGGSTMQDAALARAVVGARQQGANAVGQARVANASDTRDIATYGAGGRYSIANAYAEDNRGIGDYGANAAFENTNMGIGADLELKNALASGRYDIASALATQEQDAANRNAAAKLGYSNEAFPTALNAGQIRTGLGAAETAAKTALIPYGTAGTNNALNTLSWFGTNATPPDTTAVLANPSQAGNAIAGLGANLVGSAFKIGDLWKPAATNTSATVPASLAKTGASYGSTAGPGTFWFNNTKR